jgi:hypothetical protein
VRYHRSGDKTSPVEAEMEATAPTQDELPEGTPAQIRELHRLCLENRQQTELIYQLLYFIGERLAANPDEFYRFVQELKAYVQSNTR